MYGLSASVEWSSNTNGLPRLFEYTRMPAIAMRARRHQMPAAATGGARVGALPGLRRAREADAIRRRHATTESAGETLDEGRQVGLRLFLLRREAGQFRANGIQTRLLLTELPHVALQQLALLAGAFERLHVLADTLLVTRRGLDFTLMRRDVLRQPGHVGLAPQHFA